MSNPFDAPTAPPTSSSFETPWDFRLEYKSGKVQEAFGKVATPEQISAGFSYYDKEAAQKFSLANFTCIVVAPLAGVQGVTKDGERYMNYYSNLVKDTRTDFFQVRIQGIDKVQHEGIYADFKAQLPQGVGFTQVFHVYVVELKKYFAMALTVGLQNHLKAVIGKATNTKPEKVSLFGLCDLSSQYWGFRFTGNFHKCDKEGSEWNGKGDMYFMPEATCFTINRKPETADWFELLDGASDKVNEYLVKSQDWIMKPRTPDSEAKQPQAPTHTPNTRFEAPPAMPGSFPNVEPPIQEESAPVGVDDLPF